MHNQLCNLPERLDRRQGLEGLVSPVATGDTDHTGDTNSPLISTRSPVSPVSPVARTREGFRVIPEARQSERNMPARENFLESPGATGDTGDTASMKPGISPVLIEPDAPGRLSSSPSSASIGTPAAGSWRAAVPQLTDRLLAVGPQAHRRRADHDRSTLEPGSRGRGVSTKPLMSSRGCRKTGCGESVVCGRGSSSSQAGAPA